MRQDWTHWTPTQDLTYQSILLTQYLTYQWEIKLFEFSWDTNRKELKIRKKQQNFVMVSLCQGTTSHTKRKTRKMNKQEFNKSNTNYFLILHWEIPGLVQFTSTMQDLSVLMNLGLYFQVLNSKRFNTWMLKYFACQRYFKTFHN